MASGKSYAGNRNVVETKTLFLFLVRTFVSIASSDSLVTGHEMRGNEERRGEKRRGEKRNGEEWCRGGVGEGDGGGEEGLG